MRKVCQSIRQGFTLIELLIVVAIIIILVSVVIISISGGREKAKVARFKNVVHSIKTAAINACADGDIDYTNVTGSFGVIPEASIREIRENFSSCGPTGATTFNISVFSQGLTSSCEAVIDQTGITSFMGC